MNAQYKYPRFICIMTTYIFAVIFMNSCNESGFTREIPKEDDVSDATTPTVIINEVLEENIGSNFVQLDSYIESDGGARVIKSGICWDTKQDPTIDNSSHTTDGPTHGKIPGFLSGLEYDTQYYARAYAINPKGISYSETISFKTDVEEEDTGIYFDDFDRPALGPNWETHLGDFQIVESQILKANASGHTFYINDNAIAEAGNGHSFIFETDIHVSLVSDYVFAGIVLNAQNADNFYVIRINGTGLLQFLATNDGGSGWPGVFVIEQTDLVGKTTYHFKVTCDTPGVFNIVITKGSQIMYENTFIDSEARFNGGYVGYYSFDSYGLYDNFMLTIE